LENYLGLLLIVSAAPYVVFQDYLIYFGLGLSSARYVVKIGTNTIMYDYYQEDSASVPMIYVCFFLGVEKRDCIYGEFRQDPGSNTTNDATQTSTTKEQLQTNTVKGNFASEPDLSMVLWSNNRIQMLLLPLLPLLLQPKSLLNAYLSPLWYC
jgi:hypothetical protein